MSRRFTALGVAGGVLLAGCDRAGVAAAPAPSYAEARAIIDRRCVPCHSARPRIAAFPIAAGGLELDRASDLQRHAERIKVRAVTDKTMPLLNKTGMTEAERVLLARWIDAGAHLPPEGEPP